MSIDPSIALSVKPVQIANPLEQYMQVQQIQQAQNQSRLADLMYGEKQLEVSGDARLNELYKNAIGDDGTLDRTKLYSGVASAGLGSRLPALQKSFADADKAQADMAKTKSETGKIDHETAAHQFELAGQLASAWAQNPNVTQQQIRSGLAAALNSKIISPEIYRAKLAELDAVPGDPKSLNQWALGTLQQVQKSQDSMRYIAPDANTMANNRQSGANAKLQADTAANRLAFDKSQAESNQDAVMDPLAVRMTAQQYLAGDNSALQNFGRGAQGAANLNAVRLEVARQANAAGMSGADIAAKMAEFGGLKAGQRTAGTRSASIEIAANEVAQLAPIALDASAKVTRSGSLPFGKAQIMFDSNTNDPAMRQFAMANTALVNAYGQAMARNGTATVADKDHAREMLSTAFDQPSYAAAVAQLQKETRAAQAAPKQVRKDLSDAVSGRETSAPAAPAPAAPANSKGWTLHVDARGKKAYVSPDGKSFEEVK